MRKYNGFAPARISICALIAIALTACAGNTPYADAPVKTGPGTNTVRPAEPAAVELAPAVAAEAERQAPYRYVVKKGDTLWGIARHFLKDAWQWPEVWVVNPRVNNPHLIFPGDVLHLYWKGGRPQVAKQEPARGVERVSPQVREIQLNDAIPAIALDVIRNFLRGPQLMGREEFEKAPYVVEFASEHLLGAEGINVYAANVPRGDTYAYAVVRRGEAYHDPDTKGLLGYEAIPVGEAEVINYGRSVTTLDVVESLREVRVGDRLVPVVADQFQANFFPHSPDGPVGGKIISVFDGMSQISQYQIVAINRGSTHGIERGHVLAINQAGRRVPDPYADRRIQLPDEYAGLLMVFKVYGALSYGLVMEAERAIHVLDKVERPAAD